MVLIEEEIRKELSKVKLNLNAHADMTEILLDMGKTTPEHFNSKVSIENLKDHLSGQLDIKEREFVDKNQGERRFDNVKKLLQQVFEDFYVSEFQTILFRNQSA